MKRNIRKLIAIGVAFWSAAAVAGAEPSSKPSDAAGYQDRVIAVSEEDAAMNAAITKARASLSEFWRQFEAPEEGVSGFSLKVAISEGKATEHFWLVDIRRDKSAISGIIDNDPEIVTRVKAGERHTFREEEISDWLYLRRGKMVGNETLRVLLNHMSPDEAAYYRSRFETP